MRRADIKQTFPILSNMQSIRIAYHFYKKCFSIRCSSTRKIIGYMERIVVSNAHFVVSPSGRARVLRERVKNIHAYVQGEFEYQHQYADYSNVHMREAYYNPYFVSTFVDKESLQPIYSASLVICQKGRVYCTIDKPSSK
ncbi:hypothetical protein gpAD87_21810 [Paenibacillus sp. AD87]|nr:hypothetical protein gpAD87_21810 [Paenibacillus sp. AD87]